MRPLRALLMRAAIDIIPDQLVFQPFTVTVTIDDREQLRALTRLAGYLTNGHGLELFPLLQEQCAKWGVELA